MLLKIARELKKQGGRIVFALRDVRDAGKLISEEGMEVIQAPTHPDKFFPANAPQPQTMADILMIFGFADAKHLSGLLAAWQSVFDLVKPDLVLANYAPLSLLAARLAGIPIAKVCIPFEVPPSIHPAPPFRPTKGPNLGTSDATVISTVNTVFGPDTISAVHQIFESNKTFFVTFEELDYFGPRTNATYLGALFSEDEGDAAQWRGSGTAKRVFGYLNPGLPGFESLRLALQASPHNYSIVLRDVDENEVKRWNSGNVVATNKHVNLQSAIDACDAVVSHGGLGFTTAALLAGKPLVFHVRQFEQLLTASQVTKLGAGLHKQTRDVQTTLSALDQVLSTPRFTEIAQVFGRKYQAFRMNDVSKRIASELQEFTAKGSAFSTQI